MLLIQATNMDRLGASVFSLRQTETLFEVFKDALADSSKIWPPN